MSFEALKREQEVHRTENADRKRIRNEDLPAGSPMHFACVDCNADITVPENYQHGPTRCGPCQVLAMAIESLQEMQEGRGPGESNSVWEG